MDFCGIIGKLNGEHALQYFLAGCVLIYTEESTFALGPCYTYCWSICKLRKPRQEMNK